jgi:hypothetical protein
MKEISPPGGGRGKHVDQLASVRHGKYHLQVKAKQQRRRGNDVATGSVLS